jgi:hypothetical protein
MTMWLLAVPELNVCVFVGWGRWRKAPQWVVLILKTILYEELYLNFMLNSGNLYRKIIRSFLLIYTQISRIIFSIFHDWNSHFFKNIKQVCTLFQGDLWS